VEPGTNTSDLTDLEELDGKENRGTATVSEIRPLNITAVVPTNPTCYWD